MMSVYRLFYDAFYIPPSLSTMYNAPITGANAAMHAGIKQVSSRVACFLDKYFIPLLYTIDDRCQDIITFGLSNI